MAQIRVNGKIRAREVRVIGNDGQQVGILDLGAALTLARSHNLDLIEIAPTAMPPVCRIADFGKYKYEQAKRDRDTKKHHHANLVKEVQLTPRIDPHDLGIKMEHAVGFLCDDMKVKVVMRFRGREMARTEIGLTVMKRFLADIAPWGHPDFEPKLVGRAVTVMISPLPRGRRAPNPKADPGEEPVKAPKPEPKAEKAPRTEPKPSPPVAAGGPLVAVVDSPAVTVAVGEPAASLSLPQSEEQPGPAKQE